MTAFAKNGRSLALLSFSLQLVDALASVYPATYPFANENMKMPTLPVSKSGAVNEAKIGTGADPGGYLRRFELCDPYSPSRPGCQPGKTCHTGFEECHAKQYLHHAYNFYAQYESGMNCTAKNQYITAKQTVGTIAGVKVCDPENCCKQTKGAPFARPGFENQQKRWDTAAKTGQCKLPMDEQAYCVMTQTTLYTCIEHVPKADNSRPFQRPCWDNAFRWLLKCPLFTAKGGFDDQVVKMEPDSYLAELSIEEKIMIQPLFQQPDKVCYPYSYFNPDAVVKSSSSMATLFAALLLQFFVYL